MFSRILCIGFYLNEFPVIGSSCSPSERLTFLCCTGRMFRMLNFLLAVIWILLIGSLCPRGGGAVFLDYFHCCFIPFVLAVDLAWSPVAIDSYAFIGES